MKLDTTPLKRFILIASALLITGQIHAQCAGTMPAQVDCSSCTEAVDGGTADGTTRCVTTSKSFGSYSVNNGGTLAVCGNSTLTVTSSLNLNGGELIINENATVDHSAQLSLGGTFEIAVWGTFNRTQNINVNGGTLYIDGMVDMNSNDLSLGGGDIVIKENGVLDGINNFTGNSGGICMENSSQLNIAGNFGNDVNNIFTFGGSTGACVGWSSTTNSMNANLTASTNFTMCKMTGGSDIQNGREGSANIEDPCTSCGAFLLPVEISDFSLSRTDNGVYITWSTASETNNDFFTIQTSLDGKNFTDVGTVIGAGTSSVTNNYDFFDPSAATDASVYYRIMQTDFDGDVTYSGIGSLEPSGISKSQIRLINTNGRIEIKGVGFDQSQGVKMIAYDTKGAATYIGSVAVNQYAGFIHVLQPGTLPPGMYILRVKQGLREVNQKLAVR